MKEVAALVLVSLVILLFLGLLMFFLTRPVKEPSTGEDDKKYVQLNVGNRTDMPQKISYKGTTFVVPPFEERRIAISLGEGTILAKARRVDGSIGTFETTVSNPLITDLYITYNGFRSNLSVAENVTLRNESSSPIMFIEKASNGRRHPSNILPPMSERAGYFASKNSTWEVVIPIDEDSPLDTLTVEGIPTQIVFTGERLFAI